MIRISQQRAFRVVRLAVYGGVILLLVLGTRDLRFVRVLPDDQSTPQAPPGTLVLVRTLEQDGGEIRPAHLYFLRYPDPASGGQAARLARVVALPGETLVRAGGVLRAGGRVLPIPADAVPGWPEAVPDGHVLVLTDAPSAAHPDSRQLGPVPVQQLLWRMVLPMRILP